jgi:hypothetical protein
MFAANHAPGVRLLYRTRNAFLVFARSMEHGMSTGAASCSLRQFLRMPRSPAVVACRESLSGQYHPTRHSRRRMSTRLSGFVGQVRSSRGKSQNGPTMMDEGRMEEFDGFRHERTAHLNPSPSESIFSFSPRQGAQLRTTGRFRGAGKSQTRRGLLRGAQTPAFSVFRLLPVHAWPS